MTVSKLTVMDDVAAAANGARPAREPGMLRLGRGEFPPGQRLVMAIVNRTPDSFYRPGLTWDDAAALDRVHAVVAEGADILDIGGVPAKPGPEVTEAEEIRRVVPFVEAVRAAYPDLVISVDTWRHEPARAACEHTSPAPNPAATSASRGSQPPQVSFSRSAPASHAARAGSCRQVSTLITRSG